TFHVATGDPARVIIDYARHHVLDYIIMGARGASMTRRFLGSVSARVVAESPCSVTVVRARERDNAASRRRSRRAKKR
ncbi:MAG: universal stress protein, partial [Pseudomonadota bacterium]